MNEWRTSSYSQNGGQCVEYRGHESGVDVRDTKHRERGHITFPASEWSAFLRDLREEQF